CTLFSWRHTGERLKSFKDFSYKTWRKSAENTGVQMVFSRDGGKTWDKTARSVFPDWVCSAPVRQLPDGACILGLYGSDKESGVEVGASSRSTDRGQTWEPPVTIKAPPNVSLDAETDIIRLTDGRLYAALRDSNKQRNMRFAISDDQGKSWGQAQDIRFPGHCPHLTRLSTGEILLSHRLPQTDLHISRDDAKTWQGSYRIDDVIGAYPATVELKDGSVLIVYYTEGDDSHIRARRFKVNPTSIEFLPLS
ncbi:MAG: sialidase family protein, partial [Tepidisphaeraceae bacterium]